MTMIDSHNVYPEADRYWELVKETLQQVFQQPDTHIADDLSREVNDLPASEQGQFYHGEPLDVAADLAGQTPDDHQVDAYHQLVDQTGWWLP